MHITTIHPIEYSLSIMRAMVIPTRVATFAEREIDLAEEKDKRYPGGQYRKQGGLFNDVLKIAKGQEMIGHQSEKHTENNERKQGRQDARPLFYPGISYFAYGLNWRVE